MKILFSEEDSITHTQARYLRGGLLRNYHRVRVLRSFTTIPSADLWFHGLYQKAEIPFPDPVRQGMELFNGRIIFFQHDDRLDFTVDKIPPSLRERAQAFLRNVWPSDGEKIDPAVRGKTGLLNPFLKPTRAQAGPALNCRRLPVSFYGSPTRGEHFTRVDALRLLKKAGLPLVGGLYASPEVPLPPDDLIVQPLSRQEYLRTLADTRVALVLHGYNPLTFRLFECFSRRCLVMVQDLSSIRYADCGLTAGQHFVAFKQDLSDLADQVRYYLANPDQAQLIANAGFAHFKKHFHFSGVNLPQPLYRDIVQTWKGIDIRRPGSKTPYGLIVRWLLPLIHSL
jgi:hypothetical protein